MRYELVQVLREPDVDDGVADSVVRRFWSPRRPGVPSGWTRAMAPIAGFAASPPADAEARRTPAAEARTVDLALWGAARGAR